MAPTPLLAIIPLALVLRAFLKARRSRTRKIPPSQERVLILGASSGIGKTIAHKYAKRGARVCVLARRAGMVQEVVQECRVERGCEDGVLGCVADFTSVEDMVRVRSLIAEGAPGDWFIYDML
jgi:NAD(P)-dependent dehydrogenase (short-subunit alcohol dehydrogenase family)